MPTTPTAAISAADPVFGAFSARAGLCQYRAPAHETCGGDHGTTAAAVFGSRSELPPQPQAGRYPPVLRSYGYID